MIEISIQSTREKNCFVKRNEAHEKKMQMGQSPRGAVTTLSQPI